MQEQKPEHQLDLIPEGFKEAVFPLHHCIAFTGRIQKEDDGEKTLTRTKTFGTLVPWASDVKILEDEFRAKVEKDIDDGFQIIALHVMPAVVGGNSLALSQQLVDGQITVYPVWHTPRDDDDHAPEVELAHE